MAATHNLQPVADKEPPAVNLSALANLMARIGLFEASAFDRARDETYFSSVTTVALGLFRLVVMGEIKKGKSSFVNGLCGIPGLVPVHSDVATSTIFKLRSGTERRYTVYFQQSANNPQRKKQEIPVEQVNDFGTENGNPENVKGVDFIAVEAPSPTLQNGLIIVDTPGIGGLFRKHREITYRHAPKADAIFFVTDSVESPIGAAEVDFLKELHRMTNLIYFVQTKAAQVDADARRRRMENNVEILTTQGGFGRGDIRYFVVDSTLKADGDRTKNLEDLQDSGFVPLMKFLNGDLKRRKDLNLATVGLSRARDKFEIIKGETIRRKELLEANSAEKRDALASENRATEIALTAWVAHIRGDLTNEFQQTLSADVADVQAAMQLDLKPGGRISDSVAEKVDAAIKGGSLSATQLYENAPRFFQDARAAASEHLVSRLQALEQRASDLMRALAMKAGAQLSGHLTLDRAVKTFAETGNLSLSEIRLRPPESNSFVKLRSGFYGGLGGAAIAGVIGGIVGSVVPVVGTIIGSHIGIALAAIWGSTKTVQYQSSQELAAARQQLMHAIDKDLGNMLVTANAEFSKASQAISAQAREALQQIVDQTQQRLTEQRKAIQVRAKADKETLQKEETIVEALVKEVAEIDRQLSAFEATIRA